MNNYALIQNYIIVNIVIASDSDPQDPSYIWVNISSLNPLPSIGWTYNGNTFSNPNAITVTIESAIEANLSNFSIALSSFIATRYSDSTRLNFIGLYTNAQLNSLSNRAAYIARLFIWQNNVIEYASSYSSSVSAMTDIPTIEATIWNFSDLLSDDPSISPLAAIAIND